MTTVYRVVRASRAQDALSGEGARLYGGRWNPPGSPVVYASESRALAVLETFVHLTMEARTMQFLLYEIRLPKRPRLQHRGTPSAPRPWSSRTCREAGRAWLEAGKELALVVPSVIVPQEKNFVLNVRHSQFDRMQIGKPQPFSLDQRLWAPAEASRVTLP